MYHKIAAMEIVTIEISAVLSVCLLFDVVVLNP